MFDKKEAIRKIVERREKEYEINKINQGDFPHYWEHSKDDTLDLELLAMKGVENETEDIIVEEKTFRGEDVNDFIQKSDSEIWIVFKDCVFDRCRIEFWRLVRVMFINCMFSRCIIKYNHFSWAVFKDCKFDYWTDSRFVRSNMIGNLMFENSGVNPFTGYHGYGAKTKHDNLVGLSQDGCNKELIDEIIKECGEQSGKEWIEIK